MVLMNEYIITIPDWFYGWGRKNCILLIKISNKYCLLEYLLDKRTYIKNKIQQDVVNLQLTLCNAWTLTTGRTKIFETKLTFYIHVNSSLSSKSH